MILDQVTGKPSKITKFFIHHCTTDINKSIFKIYLFIVTSACNNVLIEKKMTYSLYIPPLTEAKDTNLLQGTFLEILIK